MKQCINCGAVLTGLQRKYCCRKCKNDFNNQVFQSYLAQQKRGRERKRKLLKLKGGECGLCGYNKNSAAMEFHHINPENKLFQLDLRSLSNRKWRDVEAEAGKCILLCSNCHAEHHNPECDLNEQ
jgi:hypothetical protein